MFINIIFGQILKKKNNMKKKLLILALFVSLSTFVKAQEGSKQIFESPKLTEITRTHKVVAIYPPL